MKQHKRNDLIQKIKKIEQQIKKLKKDLQKHIKTQYIEANGIFIVDKNGASRIWIYTHPVDGRPIITLEDLEGKVYLGLSLMYDGQTWGIVMFDKKEKVRLELVVLPNGMPSIKCYDEKGNVIYKIP
jgi:hypothetical protein